MTLDMLGIARILHVMGVVIWIGGMGFVTLVVLPVASKLPDPEARASMFERLERRFSWIARIAVLIVGVSGLLMIDGYDLWSALLAAKPWWLIAMVLWWLVFFIILFLAEPLFLHRRFGESLRRNPDRAIKRLIRAHWALLSISLVVIAAAVAGAHGY